VAQKEAAGRLIVLDRDKGSFIPAIDADTKVIPSWYVGNRDSSAAFEFIGDLAMRLSNRVQRTSDGHKPYLEAVEQSFVRTSTNAVLVKIYGNADVPAGRYSRSPCLGSKKERSRAGPIRSTSAPATQSGLTFQSAWAHGG
jgi:hypothetical protein